MRFKNKIIKESNLKIHIKITIGFINHTYVSVCVFVCVCVLFLQTKSPSYRTRSFNVTDRPFYRHKVRFLPVEGQIFSLTEEDYVVSFSVFHST